MMIKVGVLRGGPSSEHEISLLSGANILENLQREPYQAVDIYIDKEGTWHRLGKPMTPERALSDVDVAFNILHGQFGEDGSVQRILDRIGIPYTGAGAYAAAVSLNKPLTKEILAKHGVKMARHKILKPSPDLEKEALEAFRSFSPPVVVKPASAGSSVATKLAKTFDEFWEGVKDAFNHSGQVLVEEYIKGKEATAGVVEGLRGQKHYAMLPIEIVPPTGRFFDREVKYDGSTLERVPGNFTKAEAKELERLAALAHEALSQKGYSRSDFIITPKGEVYFLETNSAAGVGMTKESLVPKALKAAGISMEEFLDHVIQSALQNKRR